MDFLKLTSDPLSVEEVSNLVGDPSCGAISLFVGTTRDHFEGQIVCRLEYEAYNEMAEKEMKKICKECRSKWNLKNIAIYHRLGVVGVKEASVILAVSSEHRRESLDAVSYLIDALKSSVPIWKREVYSNEKSEWKQNKECHWSKENQHEEEKEHGGKIKREFPDSPFDDMEIKQEPLDSDPETVPPRKRKASSGTEDGKDPDQVPMSGSPDRKKRKTENEESKANIDPFFVQITASKEEMDRRIQAFQERKREELNVLNIQEFCVPSAEKEEEETSCARTTAVVLRSKGSTSHLKVTRVFNEWGPQTSGVDPGSVQAPSFPAKVPKDELLNRRASCEDRAPKQPEASTPTPSPPPQTTHGHEIPEGVHERLSNIEGHLKVFPKGSVPPSIYSRLKALEDRILFLEGLSPEYFNALQAKLSPPSRRNELIATDDDMSLSEVESRLRVLRKRLKERQLGISL